MYANYVMDTILDSYGMKPHKGRFGPELELEAMAPPNWPEVGGWHIHADNSVPGGIEYAVSTPHDRNGLIDRLEALNKAFEANKVVTRPSYRGSTHIHFNVQRERFVHVLGFIMLYTCLEPIMMRAFGKERDGNLFCLTSYDTGESHHHFRQLAAHIAEGPHNGGPRAFPARGKYSSLNVNPIPYLGSVECRIFPSTHDTQQIIQWCDVLERMMGHVKGQADLTYRQMFLHLKHNLGALNGLFYPINVEQACHPHDMAMLIQFGIQQGHELRRIHSQYMRGIKLDYEGED